jgi:hypothetical protein
MGIRRDPEIQVFTAEIAENGRRSKPRKTGVDWRE